MKKYFRILLIICAIFIMTGCGEQDKSRTKEKEDKITADTTLVSNTTWIARDNSEVIFTKDRIDWYQSQKDHTDNYYSGKYKLYRGEDAIEYITTELKEYGITEEELEDIFNSKKEYKKENFVVFDIRYDKFVLNGTEQKISRPLVPWYGFVLEDDTYLDVVNMNTYSYYGFTKQ